MPLYEYECKDGHRFEEFHAIEDRHNAVCPCGAPVHICPSLSSFRMTETITFCDHKGQVIDKKQTTKKQPPPGEV